jgi:FkbM family methyltransferase
MAQPEGYRRTIGPWLAKKEMIHKMGIAPEDVVVFDVGAYKGDVTNLYLRTWPCATYYLFEAVPSALLKLRKRFQNCPRVHVIPMAVSNEVGKAKMYVGGQVTEMSSLLRRPTEKEGRRYYWHGKFREIEVATTTLDAFVKENHIKQVHLVKADIQGAEGMMLEGAKYLMRYKPPLIWYMEVWFTSLYMGTKLFWQLSAFLNRYGYALFDLYTLGRAGVNRQLKYADALFVSRKVRSEVLDKYPKEWTQKNLQFAMGMPDKEEKPVTRSK